jgi:acyl transferase domain-containing protein
MGVDPQHRLLLELSAEVLALPSSSTSGSSKQWYSASMLGSTGAFVGASSTDYGRLAQQLRTRMAPTAYDATAATLSVASGIDHKHFICLLGHNASTHFAF